MLGKNLDFLHNKVDECEKEWEILINLLQHHDNQQIKEIISLKELKTEFENIDESLRTFYKKQIDSVSELEKFHKEEKLNSEVKLTFDEGFFLPYKEIAFQMIGKRKELKDKVYETLEDL